MGKIGTNDVIKKILVLTCTCTVCVRIKLALRITVQIITLRRNCVTIGISSVMTVKKLCSDGNVIRRLLRSVAVAKRLTTKHMSKTHVQELQMGRQL